MIGSRLGPYEITAKLGEGGMGEVYRGHDTRLKRDVAIKVLPAAFTEDKERLARFEREAQLLAQLHHPNIASIFGLEESDGTRALVMELVDGPTLAERLESGAFSITESLSTALQIAQALEEAHEKGIIHRDLKPQNIKASTEGKVKVLDFGLAKAMDPAAGSASSVADLARSPTLMQSPTLTAAHGTQMGMILGTAAYMAPEQARGVVVDKRADIWAFGVVLFEMLTGRRLFEGELVTDVLANVLKKEVDFGALPADTPVAMRRLLRRCLERNPKNRLHDIADARIVLDEVARGEGRDVDAGATVSGSLPPLRGSHGRAARWLPWAAAVAALALGVFGWLGPVGTKAPAASPAAATRFEVPPPGPGEIIGYPAIAPDGRTMAFCFAAERSVPRLWLHSFESGQSREIPGTDLAEHPFWSPDGRRVGFVARGQVRTLDVATGHFDALAPASDPRGGTWSESGEIVFSPTCCAGLSAVPAGGGAVRALTTLEAGAGESSHRFPWALPGGKSLLYTIPDGQRAGIYFLDLASGRTKLVAPQKARAVFDGRGFLHWLRDGALVARRFDPSTGSFTGESFVVEQRVGSDPNKTMQDLFAAAGGVVASRPPGASLRELRWLERGGAPAGLVGSDGYYFDPMLSPDGRRLAVARSTTPNYFDADIWSYDTSATDRATRLTFSGNYTTPVWSPDGETIYLTNDEGGRYRILAKRADGSGEEQILHDSTTPVWLDGASPREPLLALEGSGSDGNYRIWLLPLAGERKLRPFQHDSPGSQTHAAFSPDGRLLAYTSDESGLPQVYVRPVDGSPGRWQVSRDGGDVATWRADGSEIFFVGLDRILRAVPIRSVAPFAVGDEEKLAPLRIPPLAITSQHTYYLPSPDGRRFLVNQAAGVDTATAIQIILGWTPPAPAGERP